MSTEPKNEEIAGENVVDTAGGQNGQEEPEVPLELQVIDTIRTVYDPEIPVNVYDLGLIYEIIIDENSNVIVEMTLTSPNCPVAPHIVGEVEAKVNMIPDVRNVIVDLVWDPPFNMDMMSDEAKLELGLM